MQPQAGSLEGVASSAEPLAGRPLYIRGGGEAVFGFFHAPAPGTRAGSPVLIAPPFGWDEICSYRSRREWALELARSGHPVLRIDLPGSGDSGGSPRDPGQLASWSAAVHSAASWLATSTEADGVAAVGIGLGGLVLCRAIAEDAPIRELVLWAVPGRGRSLLRELRVFASLEESPGGAVPDNEPGPPPLPDGFVWAGGFVLSDETARDLERLDVGALELTGRLDRALLLDRDGVSVDERLSAHLERSGADVSAAGGNGYGGMMAQPHQARAPREVFALVATWLAAENAPALPARQAPPTRAPARESEEVELSIAGSAIRERPFTVAHARAELFGILTEPVHGPRAPIGAVLLNAGAIRRVGPNRMWVEAARRWAARGVPTLRLDLEGIGDASGDQQRLAELAELYTPALVDQVCSALDALQESGVASRFVLGGLCSGAYWSFHAALRDRRVAAAFMLNPQALFWDESLEASRALRRGVLRSSSWRKLMRGQVPLDRIGDLARRAPVALPRRAFARRSARRRGESELADALDALREADKRLRFIFSGNEPLCEELELEGYLASLDRWPNASVEFIPGQVHTLRPVQAQVGAHEALDRSLAEMLERAAHAHLAPPRGS
jgi:pimeloyl-ACP methyl ester carboxylesterase